MRALSTSNLYINIIRTVDTSVYTLSLLRSHFIYGLDITCNTSLSFELNSDSFTMDETNYGFRFIVKFKNSGANRVITYPNNIVWTGGVTPPMNVVNNYYYVKFEVIGGVVSRATYLGTSS